jgi:hypothetical protein
MITLMSLAIEIKFLKINHIYKCSKIRMRFKNFKNNNLKNKIFKVISNLFISLKIRKP